MRHDGGCQHQYCLHHFDAELNLDLLFYFNPDPLQASKVSVSLCHNVDPNPDQDPAFFFEVDPDPTSQNYRDPCRTGSSTPI
jgi:hypothetical protein